MRKELVLFAVLCVLLIIIGLWQLHIKGVDFSNAGKAAVLIDVHSR